MANRILKGYRARIIDTPAGEDYPAEYLYLCQSQSPNGPFISNQPEKPKPVTKAMAKAMMKEWEEGGYEPYKLCKVYAI